MAERVERKALDSQRLQVKYFVGAFCIDFFALQEKFMENLLELGDYATQYIFVESLPNVSNL